MCNKEYNVGNFTAKTNSEDSFSWLEHVPLPLKLARLSLDKEHCKLEKGRWGEIVEDVFRESEVDLKGWDRRENKLLNGEGMYEWRLKLVKYEETGEEGEESGEESSWEDLCSYLKVENETLQDKLYREIHMSGVKDGLMKRVRKELEIGGNGVVPLERSKVEEEKVAEVESAELQLYYNRFEKVDLKRQQELFKEATPVLAIAPGRSSRFYNLFEVLKSEAEKHSNVRVVTVDHDVVSAIFSDYVVSQFSMVFLSNKGQRMYEVDYGMDVGSVFEEITADKTEGINFDNGLFDSISLNVIKSEIYHETVALMKLGESGKKNMVFMYNTASDKEQISKMISKHRNYYFCRRNRLNNFPSYDYLGYVMEPMYTIKSWAWKNVDELNAVLDQVGGGKVDVSPCSYFPLVVAMSTSLSDLSVFPEMVKVVNYLKANDVAGALLTCNTMFEASSERCVYILLEQFLSRCGVEYKNYVLDDIPLRRHEKFRIIILSWDVFSVVDVTFIFNYFSDIDMSECDVLIFNVKPEGKLVSFPEMFRKQDRIFCLRSIVVPKDDHYACFVPHSGLLYDGNEMRISSEVGEIKGVLFFYSYQKE